jgi:hypothetical protein
LILEYELIPSGVLKLKRGNGKIKTDIHEFPGKKITFSRGKLLLEIPICCKILGENQENMCYQK